MIDFKPFHKCGTLRICELRIFFVICRFVICKALIQICHNKIIILKRQVLILVLRHSCAAPFRNLRICHLGKNHKKWRICESGMSPRICGVVICGLLKSLLAYLWNVHTYIHLFLYAVEGLTLHFIYQRLDYFLKLPAHPTPYPSSPPNPTLPPPTRMGTIQTP